MNYLDLKIYGFSQKEKELEYLREEVADRCARGIYDNVDLLKKCKVLEHQLYYKEQIEEWEKDLDIINALLKEDPEDESMIDTKATVEGRIRKLREDLDTELLLDGEYDNDNAVVSIHAGEGGTEACDWAEMLYRMYQRWAQSNGYEIEVVDGLNGSVAGIKSVEFIVKGVNAYGMLQSEMGVHRLVRVSPFDAKGRRHTSFAAVEVLPDLDDIELDAIVINPEDLEQQTFRSGGAGGQYQNTTESGVRLIHKPTGLIAESREERSQFQNKDRCLKRLKAMLAKKVMDERLKEIKELRGEQLFNEWGSQIRSYVFMPYQLVKDERTGYQSGNINAVMDGDINKFIKEYLLWRKQ